MRKERKLLTFSCLRALRLPGVAVDALLLVVSVRKPLRSWMPDLLQTPRPGHRSSP